MPQSTNAPFGPGPLMNDQLDMIESIAAQIPELLVEAKKQGYEEAIRKALSYGLTQSGASVLMQCGPFNPLRPMTVVRPEETWAA